MLNAKYFLLHNFDDCRSAKRNMPLGCNYVNGIPEPLLWFITIVGFGVVFAILLGLFYLGTIPLGLLSALIIHGRATVSKDSSEHVCNLNRKNIFSYCVAYGLGLAATLLVLVLIGFGIYYVVCKFRHSNSTNTTASVV